MKEQIKYITKWTAVATVISQRVHRELAPKPLMSVMYEAAWNTAGMFPPARDVQLGPGVVWSGLAPTRTPWRDQEAGVRRQEIHARTAQ